MIHRARSRTAVLGFLLLVGAASPGATAAPKADRATVALSAALAAEFQKNGSFETATLERPGALAALGHLALTAREPPLVGLAYETIASQLDALASEGKVPDEVPPIVGEAVLAAIGLDRSDRPVLAKAIAAASVLNRGTAAHPQGLEALAVLARRHTEADVRYAALDGLLQIGLPAMISSDLVAEVVVRSLDDTSPSVVVLDLAFLNRLGLSGLSEPERQARLEAGLGRLRSSSTPAVRAAAIATSATRLARGLPMPGLGPLGEPAATTKAFAAEMVQALGDPSPPVRGMAAVAIGLMQHVEAAPRLARLLDDRADLRATAGGVRSLASDEPIELPVRVTEMTEPQTVAMAALRGLMLLSQAAEPKPDGWLKCDDPIATFAACAKRAREWAAKRR